MNTGQLIRKYRKIRKLTQVQLAKSCGLTDSAIRNYELGNRTPGDEQLTQIADALNVSVEALREIPLKSSRQALELLFRLSDQFSLQPLEKGEELVLAAPEGSCMGPKLASALKAWRKQLDSLEAGESTQAEYEEWRASFDS